MKSSNVTLFLENGQTFHFEDVTKFKEALDILSFHYRSQATGAKKVITVYKENVVAVARGDIE
jgi:hypothetical protein